MARKKITFHLKKNALHDDLHVPHGEPIPEAKLEGALHSSDPKEKKRAVFAENAKHFHHPKKLGLKRKG